MTLSVASSDGSQPVRQIVQVEPADVYNNTNLHLRLHSAQLSQAHLKSLSQPLQAGSSICRNPMGRAAYPLIDPKMPEIDP